MGCAGTKSAKRVPSTLRAVSITWALVLPASVMTLEVLSLVAYKQPITKSQMEALGKFNAGSVLRQLVQRELIRIDRAHAPQNSKSKNDPPYTTTPRFLSLFGLGNLNDLPVAEDFAFK